MQPNDIIMPYKVIDIANKVLAKGTTEEDLVSNMKLQKLLYYMQGFYLAYFDKPLFNDELEAWMYGPVVPKVYESFKENGSKGIEYTGEVIKLGTENEEKLFNEVYRVYAKYSATGLMEMTHSETPWKATNTGVGNVISQEVMKQFFKKRLKN